MNTKYNYSYDPPPGGTSEWITRAKYLIEPPACYLTFAVGIALAIWLSLSGSRYGYHILILLIALPVHELAHALTADRLGDHTPRYYGHITLNPFAQLNLIGSFLVLMFGLGWAYVPITPNNLRPNPRTGHMIVAAAGPIATLLLAFATAILWQVLSPAFNLLDGRTYLTMLNMFYFFTYLNIALFIFNLIPLMPLDGFFVLRGLLPPHLAYQLDKIRPYSNIVFLALFLPPLFTGGRIDFIGPFIFGPAQWLARLLY
ncbi:site-2 protease family protein [Anaerolineales bacterium HSG6]|nr:site-2 protease family protein [Anaerolineales bacterium HSG6]